MIVRFDFETNSVCFVKFYYARVIFKNADAPGFIKLLCRFKDRIFYKIIEMNFFAFEIEINAAPESFVRSGFAAGRLR